MMEMGKQLEIMATVRRDKEAMSDEEHFVRLVERLYALGVRNYRINIAKFNAAELELVKRDVKRVNQIFGRDIQLILDIPYPGEKIRCCMKQEPLVIDIHKGDFLDVFSQHQCICPGEHAIEVTASAIGSRMTEGDKVLYGDGTIGFVVHKVVNPDHIRLQALNDGTMEHSKALIAQDSLTCSEKNLSAALQLRQEMHISGMAFSFVENREQLCKIRHFFRGEDIRLISKIETARGVEQMEDIIAETDEVMLGRGDLGLFSDIRAFGMAQDKVIEVCRRAGKKIWIATDVLASLESKNIPSRADLTDIYHIGRMGADGVVLTYGVVRSQGLEPAVSVIRGQRI